jgi:hypothetical protein
MKTPLTLSSFRRPTIDRSKFWGHHVGNFKKSGLSRASYCKQNQIEYSQFTYWLKKKKEFSPALIAINVKPEDISADSKPLCTLIIKKNWILNIHSEQALFLLLDKMGE